MLLWVPPSYSAGLDGQRKVVKKLTCLLAYARQCGLWWGPSLSPSAETAFSCASNNKCNDIFSLYASHSTCHVFCSVTSK